MAALLAVTVLSGCEDSQRLSSPSASPGEPVAPPIDAENPAFADPVPQPVPAEPAVEESPEKVATPDETAGEAASVVEVPREAVAAEQSKPLVLTIETGPAPEQTGNHFGKASDSGRQGYREAAGGPGDSGSGKLLPDLFDRKQARKPVSVRSELLIDESSADMSRSVDGAGVVIEFNTD